MIRFDRRRVPWTFLAIAAVATAIAWQPAWQEALQFDRSAIGHGELWRIWTGHLVHSGWPHFCADTGLFLILGCLLEPAFPRASRWSLLLMPLFISAAIYLFDPGTLTYAGLSAMNLGFLVFLACRGWQRNWWDWFWPAVLAIYVGEVVFETLHGGHGGGMIRFDDPTATIATNAHIVGAIYGVGLWALGLRQRHDAKSLSPIER